LAEGSLIRPVLPAFYLYEHPDFGHALESLWRNPTFDGLDRHGVGFWFLVHGAGDGRR
jgi:hypothetical protein